MPPQVNFNKPQIHAGFYKIPAVRFILQRSTIFFRFIRRKSSRDSSFLWEIHLSLVTSRLPDKDAGFAVKPNTKGLTTTPNPLFLDPVRFGKPELNFTLYLRPGAFQIDG